PFVGPVVLVRLFYGRFRESVDFRAARARARHDCHRPHEPTADPPGPGVGVALSSLSEVALFRTSRLVPQALMAEPSSFRCSGSSCKVAFAGELVMYGRTIS